MRLQIEIRDSLFHDSSQSPRTRTKGLQVCPPVCNVAQEFLRIRSVSGEGPGGSYAVAVQWLKRWPGESQNLHSRVAFFSRLSTHLSVGSTIPAEVSTKLLHVQWVWGHVQSHVEQRLNSLVCHWSGQAQVLLVQNPRCRTQSRTAPHRQRRFCHRVGLATQQVEPVKGKPVLLATWPGRDPSLPALLLNSHYDVVPAMEAAVDIRSVD